MSAKRPLEGKKIAILAEDLFEDLELYYPLIRLREAGAEVRVAGPEAKKSFKGKRGLTVESDTSFDKLDAKEMDAVVVPGGYAPDRLRRHESALRFVRNMDASGKCVAAICHAGWVPISAGIVSGKKVTSFAAIKDDLENAGAGWVDEPLVVDGNLVTSRTPADLPYFCPAIIERVAEQAK